MTKLLRVPVLLLALSLALPSLVSAQEWKEFTSKDDKFTAWFPGEPSLTTRPWTSEFGALLEAHVYTATQGPSTYTLTVVDHSSVQKQLTDKAKQCAQGDERCDGATQYSGAGYWKNDVRGAMAYGVFSMLKRPNEQVTHFGMSVAQAMEVNQVQLLNNVNNTRTHAIVYMHEYRLYILEATVPKNYPAPQQFTLSITLYHDDMTVPRYGQAGGVYYFGARVDPFERSSVATRPTAGAEGR